MNDIKSYTMLKSVKEIGLFQKDLALADSVGFDLETNGLDWIVNDIRVAQFEVNNNIYILNLDEGSIERFKYVIDLIVGYDKTVVMHNGKFDIKFTLAKTGIHLTNIFDTQVAEAVLTAGIGTGFVSLQALLYKYCNVEANKDTRLLFLQDNKLTEEMLLYSAQDVKHLNEIKRLQENKASNLKMSQIFDLEMKLLPVVALMEYDGVLLDWDKWMELHASSIEISKESKNIFTNDAVDKFFLAHGEKFENAFQAYKALKIPVTTKKFKAYLETITVPDLIKASVKKDINLNSSYQMLRLFRGIGLDITSTGKKILARHVDNEPLIKYFQDYKVHTKRIDTYGESWREHVHPVTGRVHAEYNQVGTATGRWSCNKPNLQNVIAEKEYRSCFISRPGYLLCTADYSQAELRLVGSISGEQVIIDAYINDEDIHSKTASLVFEVSIELVDKHQRDRGKTLNFSILYGSTPWGIAVRNEDISQTEADDLVKRFFGGYPQLGVFIKLAQKFIWEHKISKTPFGRIRFFEEKRLFEDNKAYINYKSTLEREGFNHIVQGGSSDCLKMAIVDAFYNNPFGHDKFRFLMQVHDEVVVEIMEDIKEEATEFLVDCMERAEQQFLGDIPAVVDYKLGTHWIK